MLLTGVFAVTVILSVFLAWHRLSKGALLIDLTNDRERVFAKLASEYGLSVNRSPISPDASISRNVGTPYAEALGVVRGKQVVVTDLLQCQGLGQEQEFRYFEPDIGTPWERFVIRWVTTVSVDGRSETVEPSRLLARLSVGMPPASFDLIKKRIDTLLM